MPLILDPWSLIPKPRFSILDPIFQETAKPI